MPQGKTIATLALWLGFAAAADAQAPVQNQAPKPPLRQKPVSLDSHNRHLQPPGRIRPGEPMAPETPPAEEAPEAEKKPTGPTVGDVRPGVRKIEKFKIQRVPIFPDDPESAWWEANPRDAFAIAHREQRPMLLLFTADWNAKCLALSEEVFTTKTFSDYVKNNVVACYLNYGRSKIDNPDSMRHWKEKFKINGYPNLLVFDPDGNVVQQVTGYRTGRPVTYFNELKQAVQPVINAANERKQELRMLGFRDWRNREDRTLFARFIKWGGGLVTLQSADRRVWTIELPTLSETDQQFVRSFPMAGEVAAGQPVGP